jgi:hypothetical protein
MTTRQCPQCGKFINSMNDFIHCSRIGPCPPREAHYAADTHYLDHGNEDLYLDWLMGVYMVEAAGANVGQGAMAPPTPAVPEEQAGGGLFGGAGASGGWDEKADEQTHTAPEPILEDAAPPSEPEVSQ